ncbi:MAG: DNA-3-methyladenine glycosylase [Bacteroidia bacterium]|nr:MAG: DNA-3-methyladenine glycosylase [Bacteroidia bacterium]
MPGKYLVVRGEDNIATRHMITEVEAYRGTDDLACHASRGRTNRTEVMFRRGGYIYIYLIYGMYWMLNIVTGHEDNPQAILIRGVEKFSGPGRLTRGIGIDKSLNGTDLTQSDIVWIERGDRKHPVEVSPRIGIDYAGEPWKSKPWRYFISHIL